MALDSKHPQFAAMLPLWEQMRACFAGELAIKAASTLYLPPTPGHILDGMVIGATGYQKYQAYKALAVYPPYVSEAVKAMIGVMHHKPAVIELPAAMEPLRARATFTGESLDLLLRRINEAQLITGRYGLLLDIAEPTAALPYIATYDAETIINWDDGTRYDSMIQTPNLVVLNETEMERQANFEWREVRKYRVLILGDPDANEAAGIYRQGTFREQAVFNEAALTEPNIRGNMLPYIPFVFINSTDLLPDPMNPSLLELSNLCLTIYRGEAGRRFALYMQGQDTLVTIGGRDDDEVRVGAGAKINVDIGGDAKYIGVGSGGLPELRQAVEADRKQAAQMGAQLLDTTSREKESGEALRVRVAAQTATLNQIALAGAEGLQTILRMAAEWIGADPASVQVTPNLDFADGGMTPRELMELTQAKQSGLPISDESLHEILVEMEYTAKKFSDEMALIEQERDERARQNERLFNGGFIPVA